MSSVPEAGTQSNQSIQRDSIFRQARSALDNFYVRVFRKEDQDRVTQIYKRGMISYATSGAVPQHSSVEGSYDHMRAYYADAFKEYTKESAEGPDVNDIANYWLNDQDDTSDMNEENSQIQATNHEVDNTAHDQGTENEEGEADSNGITYKRRTHTGTGRIETWALGDVTRTNATENSEGSLDKTKTSAREAEWLTNGRVKRKARSYSRSTFLVAVRRRDEEVVGCVALEPSRKYGDWYSWVLQRHKSRVLMMKQLTQDERQQEQRGGRSGRGNNNENSFSGSDSNLQGRGQGSKREDAIRERERVVKMLLLQGLLQRKDEEGGNNQSAIHGGEDQRDEIVLNEKINNDEDEIQSYDDCELRRLSVCETCRGTGVGQLILATALAWAEDRGYHAVHWTTSETMPAAMKFYRKLNFSQDISVRAFAKVTGVLTFNPQMMRSNINDNTININNLLGMDSMDNAMLTTDELDRQKRSNLSFSECYTGSSVETGIYWPITHFRVSFDPFGDQLNPFAMTPTASYM